MSVSCDHCGIGLTGKRWICGGCHVYYCGVECQTLQWYRGHWRSCMTRESKQMERYKRDQWLQCRFEALSSDSDATSR